MPRRPLKLSYVLQVFVQNLGRKEPRVVLVYDNDRPLNTSPEAVALRSYLQTESVELIGSQGTTQQTLEDVCFCNLRSRASCGRLYTWIRFAGDSQNCSYCQPTEHDSVDQFTNCISGCVCLRSAAQHFCGKTLQYRCGFAVY